MNLATPEELAVMHDQAVGAAQAMREYEAWKNSTPKDDPQQLTMFDVPLAVTTKQKRKRADARQGKLFERQGDGWTVYFKIKSEDES